MVMMMVAVTHILCWKLMQLSDKFYLRVKRKGEESNKAPKLLPEVTGGNKNQQDFKPFIYLYQE